MQSNSEQLAGDSTSIDADWQARIRDSRLESRQEVEATRGDLSYLPKADFEAIFTSPESEEKEIQRLIEIASAARRELLEADTFIYSDDVAAIMSRGVPGVEPDEVRVLTAMGSLIGVVDYGRTIYPTFQFDAGTGLPYEEVAQVNELLGIRSDTWGALSWWLSPSVQPQDRVPASMLAASDQRVELVSAIERFCLTVADDHPAAD